MHCCDDVMGMNRYKAVGNPAKTAMTENDKNILINYQKEELMILLRILQEILLMLSTDIHMWH